MSDNGTGLSVEAWAQDRIGQAFGMPGLIGLALASVLFYLWTHWSVVRAWPGIAYLTTRIRRRIPRADPTRYSVAVAKLSGDNERGDYRHLILTLLRELEPLQVLNFDFAIVVTGTASEELERKGHQQALEFLNKTGASLLIWGSLLHYDGQTRPALYMTAACHPIRRSRQYMIETGMQFRLPKLFWNDLSRILGLIVIAQHSQYIGKAGQFDLRTAMPFVQRVRELLASSLSVDLDPDARALMRVSLATALDLVEDHHGKTNSPHDPVHLCRQALLDIGPHSKSHNAIAVRLQLTQLLISSGLRESDTQKHDEAIAILQDTLHRFPREQNITQWAALTNSLGLALHCKARLTSDVAKMGEAEQIYRELMPEGEVLPRDQWLVCQLNVGAVLLELGEREPDNARLEEALVHSQKILLKTDRANQPLLWASAHINCGTALRSIGERSGSQRKIEQAEAHFQHALTENSRQHVPILWAKTQNSLGKALMALAECERSMPRANQAILAFRCALEVFSRAAHPIQWAKLQMNLGSVLCGSGWEQRSVDRCREGIAAFQQARLELTREREPLEWGTLHHNLGVALTRTAQLERSSEGLRDAIVAFGDSLRERCRRNGPIAWGKTQNWLGCALAELGTQLSDPQHLSAAVAAHQQALEELTRDRVPKLWGKTQNDLGIALSRLGRLRCGSSFFEDAAAAFRYALQEYTRESNLEDWATIHHNLGMALQGAATMRGCSRTLSDAISVYLDGLLPFARGSTVYRARMLRSSLRSALDQVCSFNCRNDSLLLTANDAYDWGACWQPPSNWEFPFHYDPSPGSLAWVADGPVEFELSGCDASRSCR